ncbi:MAG: GTP-binding protein [Reyranellaceae bacterium]
MSESGQIPVSLLTGFLGSGKTTLLNRLLKRPDMGETAVIVNEFGEVGLDHLLMESGSEDMTVLNSGCLCCTVRGDLIETMGRLFVRRAKGEVPAFKRLLIETTGLADPAPVLHTLMTDPLLAARYRLDSVIATVDAVNGQSTLDNHEEAVKQAAVADRLLLTKTDLATPEQVAALTARLKALNPGAPLLEVRNGDIAPAELFNAGLYNPETKTADVRGWLREEAFAAAHGGHDHHHDHDHGDEHHHHHGAGHGQDPHDVNRHDEQIRAFCLVLEQPLPWQAVTSALDALVSYRGPDMLRLKGILNVEGSDKPVVVHGVQHVFHPPAMLDEWPDEDRRSKLVFITRNIERGTIERLFAAFTDQAREAEQNSWDDLPAARP